MRSYNETRRVAYPADHIKNIILDVEQYPQFIPWCSEAKILSRDEENFSFNAELIIDFKALKESYISNVSCRQDDNGSYLIEVKAISGPFAKLENIWQIKPGDNPNESIVDFTIEFAFKSALLNMFSGAFFSLATEKMINAFMMRAKKLYTQEKISKN